MAIVSHARHRTIPDGSSPHNARRKCSAYSPRMEYRQLGGSGLKGPVLSFGTGTFGGEGELFKAGGGGDVAEATQLIDVCVDAGLTMFDTDGDPRARDEGASGLGAGFAAGTISE